MSQMRSSVSRLFSVICCLTAFVAPGLIPTALSEPVDADLLLVGGTLHIGDGSPGVVGDVAIHDERIVAVGKFEHGEIKQRLNCEGLVVSPGFIDLHNHSDRPVTRKATRAVTNYLAQGCTTIVTGNCGSGPVDVNKYYATLDEHGIGVNVAHLLPQGSLREDVMNSERREASDEELSRMKELADKAMQDGAWGMSTGLIYVPSSYADTAELTQIAQVVAKHNGIYASHIRGEGTGLLKAVQEAMEIGENAGLPVHISHFKSSGQESWGLVRVAIEMIEKQRAAGQVVTADQYPYIASSTSLGAIFIPAWARAGSRKQMLERMNDEESKQRIHDAINRKLTSTDQGQRIQIARHRPQPGWAGRRLKEIADELGISPFDLIMQIERDGGASVVNFGINEDDVRVVMQKSWVATASDGSSRLPSDEMPHPRSYGTFSRKIGYYSVREEVIPLEQAIRSSSGLPADILGMTDRGYLRVGQWADIAIWNRDKLIDKATFDAPHQYSEGIEYLLVNGTPAIWQGDVTGALAGKPLRHSADASQDEADDQSE